MLSKISIHRFQEAVFPDGMMSCFNFERKKKSLLSFYSFIVSALFLAHWGLWKSTSVLPDIEMSQMFYAQDFCKADADGSAKK